MYTNKYLIGGKFRRGKISSGENFVGGKFRRGEISSGKHFVVGKFRRGKISSWENFVVGKFRRGKISSWENFVVKKFRQFSPTKKFQNFVIFHSNISQSCQSKQTNKQFVAGHILISFSSFYKRLTSFNTEKAHLSM